MSPKGQVFYRCLGNIFLLIIFTEVDLLQTRCCPNEMKIPHIPIKLNSVSSLDCRKQKTDTLSIENKLDSTIVPTSKENKHLTDRGFYLHRHLWRRLHRWTTPTLLRRDSRDRGARQSMSQRVRVGSRVTVNTKANTLLSRNSMRVRGIRRETEK